MFIKRTKVYAIFLCSFGAFCVFIFHLDLHIKKRFNHLLLDSKDHQVPDESRLTQNEEGLKNLEANGTKMQKDLEPCKVDLKDRGPVFVNQSTGMKMDELISDLTMWIKPGGWWSPMTCTPNKSVGIVIPFRDREEHLVIFLRHMHPYLMRQKIRYRIYVIEQANPEQDFNRGMLMNVGYVSAKKLFHESHDCFIFHDIDLIPEDERNDYSCPSSTSHMSVAVSTMNYRLKYDYLFGGVEAFWWRQFEQINGFPNRFWGWGGEDDDLYYRITKHGLKLNRQSITVARYTMLKHIQAKKPHVNLRLGNLSKRGRVFTTDGLNSLDYNVVTSEERPLYSYVLANLHITNATKDL